MIKTVRKEVVDNFISCFRIYYRSNGKQQDEALKEIQNISLKIEKDTRVSFIYWQDLLTSILGEGALLPKATNMKVYAVLSLLGWEVVDE